MKMINKAALITCPLVLLLSLLTACNTVHGVGRDVRATGNAISEAAAAADDHS